MLMLFRHKAQLLKRYARAFLLLVIALFINLSPVHSMSLRWDPKELFPAQLNNRMGFTNSSGVFVIPPVYEKVWDFSHHLARVQMNGVIGYIDTTGSVVIPPQYPNAGDFVNDLAPVKIFISKTEGKWGYIDKTGLFIIPPVYETVHDFHEGYASIMIDYKYGYINKSNKIIWQSKSYYWEFMFYIFGKLFVHLIDTLYHSISSK